MNYTPSQIADWFLCNIDRESGESITHLKLHKLVYYAQAWALTLFNEFLFDEDFQAWTHGPVIYTLYDRFRNSGWDSLPSPDNCIEFPEHIEKLLKEVLDVYGKYGAKYLEELTHNETPWIEARKGIPLEAYSNSIITKESMKKYYSNLLES